MQRISRVSQYRTRNLTVISLLQPINVNGGFNLVLLVGLASVEVKTEDKKYKENVSAKLKNWLKFTLILDYQCFQRPCSD